MPENLIQLHQIFMDVNRIPYVVAAILVTFICGLISGPLFANANPAFWGIYNFFIGTLGDRMDKTSRPRGDLIFRGFIITVFCLVFSYLLGNILTSLSASYFWIEFLTLCACLTGGSVWYIVLSLYFALAKNTTKEGIYYPLSRSTRVNLNSTDDFGIVRESISYLAISFDKGVVAPAFWYLIGGLPVMLLYSTLAALSWRFGKSGFSKGFGLIPVELEKLMGFAPSLFSGFLFTAASILTPTASIIKAFSQWFKGIGKAPYEQGGFVVSALSWSLNISLGGSVQDLSGSTLKKVWIGPKDATAKVDFNHIKRALYAGAIANLLFIFALLLVYILDANVDL